MQNAVGLISTKQYLSQTNSGNSLYVTYFCLYKEQLYHVIPVRKAEEISLISFIVSPFQISLLLTR